MIQYKKNFYGRDMKEKSLGKSKYFLMLIGVVIIWGISPNITKGLLSYYSPGLRSAMSSVVAFVAMLIVCAKKLKNLNKEYFKVALPTGIFYSAACIMQSVGLVYTSPAMFSFLENLSCLVVPFLVWIMTKNRPSIFKFVGAILCLVSVFILSGGSDITSFNFGIGEILCGLAGMFYGVNIAVTGIKAKKLDAGLYLLIQFGVHMVVSTTYAFAFEEIAFSTKFLPLLVLVVLVLISTVLGWLIRTICLTHLDPSLVAVVMPFSSVVTTVISVILGTDILTWGLIVGAIVGVLAVISSDLDIKKIMEKRRSKKFSQLEEEQVEQVVEEQFPPNQDV